MGAHDHHHHHGPVRLDEADWQAWAEHTELEGEVLVGFVTETAAQVSERRGPEAAPVRRVLDVGSGPGVGTCELARLFPDAQVTAADSSPAMLDRTTRRAQALGLEGRVRTVEAELPGGLDGLEPVDVIWSSMALHHVGDEVAALRVMRDLLAPHGLVAIAERADPTRVLPEPLGIGRPGLAERIDRAGAAWFDAMRAGLDGTVPSADLRSMVDAAGLEVVAAHTARQKLDPPLSDAARRFVRGSLVRIREQFHELLDEEDLRTLDVLSDPDHPRGVMHRPDVFVEASRQVVIARPVR